MSKRICPLCGSPLIRENGLLVCSNCGYIVGEELLPKRFDGVHYIKEGGFRSINNIVSRLNLPSEVSEMAKEVIMNYEASTGKRATISTLIASVIIASRLYGIPIPIKEVSKKYPRLSPSNLALTIGTLKNTLPKREGVPWEGYINYLIGKLSRDERVIEILKNSSGRLSPQMIIERLRINSLKEMRRIKKDKRSRMVGRNPVYIAAAIIYMTGKKIGIRGLSQDLIADALGASRSAISKALAVVRRD